MHLISVRLRCFCQHEKFDAEFRPGLNGILGRNGRGKSNTLDALRFAITGESINPGGKKDNITWGKDKARVEVVFTEGDTTYELMRAVESAKATLKFNDQTINKSSEIDDFLVRLLGCPMRALLDNVFIPQGKIDSILFARSSDRLKEFQQTFGLDKAAEAHKWLGQEANLYSVTAGLDQQLNGCVEAVLKGRTEVGELTAAADEKRRLITELEVFNTLLKQALEATRSAEAIRQADARVNELFASWMDATHQATQLKEIARVATEATQPTLDQVPRIDAELRVLEQDLTLYQRSAAIRPQLAAAIAAHAALPDISQATLAEKRHQRDGFVAEYNRFDGMLKNPATRPKFPAEADFEARILEAEKELAAIPASLKPEQDELGMVFQLEQLGKHIELAKAGKCPTCAAPFTHDPVALEAERTALREQLRLLQHERRNAYQALRDNATGRLQALVRELTTIQAGASATITGMRDDATRGFHAVKAEVDQLEAAEKAKAAAQRQVELLQAQLNGAPTVVPDEAKITSFRAFLANAKEAEKQVQQHQNDFENARTRLQVMGESHDAAKRMRETLGQGMQMPTVAEIEIAKGKVQELELARTALSELQHQLAVQTVALQEREKTAVLLREQLAREAKDAAWVEQVRKVRDTLHVGALPSLMMREYAQILNLRMEHYLEIWESPFRMWLDDEMSFRVKFEGGECDAARLSGGQRIVASASFRLAMSDTFARQVGLLVFDEPSTFLDKENIQHLQMLLLKLKDMSRHTGRQILVVTHEEALMNFLDHVIEIP